MTGNTENGTENNERAFMVVVRICGASYLTKVWAYSDGGAECKVRVLAPAIPGAHKNAVEGCQAFDVKEMATECFAYMAIEAIPVDFALLTAIIRERNEQIKAEVRRKARIKEIAEQIAQLEAERKELCEQDMGVA